jgi:hypothetical protein
MKNSKGSEKTDFGDIYLELKETNFGVGDTVSGVINLDVKRGLKAEGVYFKLKGTEKIHLALTQSGKIQEFKDHIDIIDQTVRVYNFSHSVLKPG